MIRPRCADRAGSDAGRSLSLRQSAAGCAVLFQDASCSWAADSSVAALEARSGSDGGSGAMPVRDVSFRSARAWWPGDLVLKELCLALPVGSLTAVVGDVGAGAHGLSFLQMCTHLYSDFFFWLQTAAGGYLSQNAGPMGKPGQLLEGIVVNMNTKNTPVVRCCVCMHVCAWIAVGATLSGAPQTSSSWRMHDTVAGGSLRRPVCRACRQELAAGGGAG